MNPGTKTPLGRERKSVYEMCKRRRRVYDLKSNANNKCAHCKQKSGEEN